jgi:aldose 1-epimerase
MPFTIASHRRDFPGRPGATVWTLAEPALGCRAEVTPDLGGNCFRWQITEAGRPVDLLYSDPAVFPDGRPTRSGIPVLFPFPNRIRDGRFTWDGKTYQLPLNDSSGKNAIHGFACRSPWRTLATGADATAAWVTMEFQASLDVPASRQLWPADHRLTLTVRLQADRLRLEASVTNPDRAPLPFGLGYHPYFQVGTPDDMVFAPAGSYWELRDSLPTGRRLPLDAARDLNRPRPVRELQLDDVLSELPPGTVSPEGMIVRGQCGRVSLWSSRMFRELVAFTPPHRQAVCLEPYTCTTDAVNLEQQGIDVGWLVLAPGNSQVAVVEMVVSAP